MKKKWNRRSLSIALWLVAGLYLLIVSLSVLYYMKSLGKSWEDFIHSFKQLMLLPLAWTGLLLVEGLFYWKFDISQGRPQAWIHVISMFAAFVVTILFTILANFYVSFNSSHGDITTRFGIIYKINRYVFWAFFIIGHILFVSVIIQRFSSNKKNTVDEPASGILDEFAD